MTDQERFDAIENRDVIFHSLLDSSAWEARYKTKDGLEATNWHCHKSLREAIDLAMGDKHE
jgi:hypothetical protein